MLNAKDHENLVKSCQTANLLVQDLCGLIKCDNPLLAELTLDTLQQVVQIEQRLKRIESSARPVEATPLDY